MKKQVMKVTTKEIEALLKEMQVPRYLLVSLKPKGIGTFQDRVVTIGKFINSLKG